MLACAEAGADIIDTATDSLSGSTSQPAVSAVLSVLEGTVYEPELNFQQIREIDEYWAHVRLLYSGFDAGLNSPDPGVYTHEIPGDSASLGGLTSC